MKILKLILISQRELLRAKIKLKTKIPGKVKEYIKIIKLNSIASLGFNFYALRLTSIWLLGSTYIFP